MDDLLQFDNSLLRREWAEYVEHFATWLSFWTLTFSEADRTHEVTKDECVFKWRRLVQALNRQLYGNSYTRIVGHCYFSYALSFEYQTRGALHMHVLVDQPTNWEAVNRLWRHMAGICKIVPVHDTHKVASYLCKYITKGGDVILYRAPNSSKVPSFKPAWYLEATGKLEAQPAE